MPFCLIKVIPILLKISLLLPELHISNSITFPFSGPKSSLSMPGGIRHENNLKKHKVELKKDPVAMTMASELNKEAAGLLS